MQDQLANIENRLEELTKPININDNSDDDTSALGGNGGRGGGNDGKLLLDLLVEMNLMN